MLGAPFSSTRLRLIVVFLASILIGGGRLEAQSVSDATGPIISSIGFSATSVDTTSGAISITASVGATDDLSGVNYIYLYLRTLASGQPNSTSSISCYVQALQSGGTRTDGVFTGTCSFPQYSRSGTWFVYQAYAYDNVGNYTSYYNSGAALTLSGETIPTIAVTAPTAPPPSASSVPELISVSFSPAAIDTTSSSASVTVTARVTSDGNFSYAYVYFRAPTGSQAVTAYIPVSSRIAGDINDGVYQSTVTLPKYSRDGNWFAYQVYVYASASSAHRRYYNMLNGILTTQYVFDGATATTTNLGTSGPTISPATLAVTSNPDTVPPSLVYFALNPPSIDVATSSSTVTVSLAASDDLSGFSYALVQFRSPNGQQNRSTSVSAANGYGTIFFPQYSEAGNWLLNYLYLYDVMGNSRFFDATALAAEGFPNSIQISSGLTVANVTSPVGGVVDLSATLTHLGVGVPNQTITFTLQGASVGSATTDGNGLATLQGVSIGALTAGNYPNAIAASFAGDGEYAAASGQASLFVTNKLNQTINFPSIPDHALSDSPFSVSATASSGLPVTFAAVGDCSVSGNVVTLTAAGSCQIVASQSGNATYNPAPTVARSFSITAKLAQTITFGSIADQVYGAAPFGLDASAPAGAVTFTLGSGSMGCSISGATLSVTGATAPGQYCTVVAQQPGNATYDAAPDVTRSFSIAKASQTITFAPLTNRVFGDPAFALNATAPGGAVTFALGDTSTGCTLSGSTVTITGSSGPGEACSIVASQAGGVNYLPAIPVTRSFTIGKATQTITFGPLPNRTYGDAPFMLSASAPGGVVTFGLGASSAGCSLDGMSVTIVGATSSGEACIIVATQPGSANYHPAPTVTRTFTIDKASQSIAFGALSDRTFGDPPFGLDASASSGLPVSFSSVGVCSVSENTVTMTMGGTCTITASQEGNANFTAAEGEQRTFNVSYTWTNVLPPIKVDGTSLFKRGSTIPVKFQLTGASASVTNLAARIFVAMVSTSVVGSEIEATSTSAADSGNMFRYDDQSGQYVFNLSTKGMEQGTWQIRIDLLDNQSHVVLVSLRK